MKRIDQKDAGEVGSAASFSSIPSPDSIINTWKMGLEHATAASRSEIWVYVDVILPAVADGWAKDGVRNKTDRYMDAFVTCSDEALSLWMLMVYKAEWEITLADVEKHCKEQTQVGNEVEKQKGRKGSRPSLHNIGEFSKFGRSVQGIRTTNKENWRSWMMWVRDQYKVKPAGDWETMEDQQDYTGMGSLDNDDEVPFMDDEVVLVGV